MLVMSNAKLHERDLPIYSNVRERNYKGHLIYLEVHERILSVLLINFDVHGSAKNFSECIADKR